MKFMLLGIAFGKTAQFIMNTEKIESVGYALLAIVGFLFIHTLVDGK